MHLLPRTRLTSDSPIGATAHLVAQVRREGAVLDASQGAPSYPTAPMIAARMAEVAGEPDGNRYAPGFGLPELRRLVAQDLSRDYDAEILPEQVLVTAGCNQAFCVVTSSLSAYGDEILLHEPYYFNHDMWLRLDQVRPVHYDTDARMVPSPASVADKITERTRAIVVVTPGNPTGATAPPDVLAELYAIAVRHDLVLILDETYRSFRGTAMPAHDLFSHAGWPEHLVSLHSFSKDFAMPGARVGAAVGDPALLAEAMKLLDCMAICAPRIGQEGAIAALRDARGWRAARGAQVGSAQRIFERAMSDRPGGFELESAGAFYGWVRHPFDTEATADVVERLVVQQGVVTIPGTAFTRADDHHLRVSFGNLSDDQIRELGARLEALD